MDKIVKRAKKTIIFLALSTVCAILIGKLFIINSEKSKKIEEENVGVHLSKNKRQNELVYVDSETEPVKFAETDDGDVLAFVIENNNIYVVQLTEDEENDINNYFKSNTAKYNIKGNSVMITDDIKKLIIDGYNEITNSNNINEDNFESVFGEYYIDANSWVSDADGYKIFAWFLFIVAFITAISTLKRIKYLKETLNSDKFLAAANEKVLADYKYVVFTKNYMVTLVKGLSVIEIHSIAWAYHYVFKYKFMPNHNFVFYLKDKKRQGVNFWFSGRKVDEIVNYIAKTNSKALVGYTEENIKKFNEMQKQDI